MLRLQKIKHPAVYFTNILPIQGPRVTKGRGLSNDVVVGTQKEANISVY